MISEYAFKLKKNGEPCKGHCLCRHPELIENYDKAIADTTQTWICHHRLETHNSEGERRLVGITGDELIALDMYFDRPADELIFLACEDHTSLHKKGKKHGPISEEHRKKISEAKKEKPSRRKGKHLSEETKKKMSEAQKGERHPMYGKHWKLVDGKRVYY